MTIDTPIWSTEWQSLNPELHDRLAKWANGWEAENHRQAVVLAFLGSASAGVPPCEARDLDLLSARLEEIVRSDRPAVDLILRVRGGNMPAAVDVVHRALSFPSGQIRSFVSDWATSAGSLIAVSCGEVVMDQFGYLGPCVPQVTQLPDIGAALGIDHIEAVGALPATCREALRDPVLLIAAARSLQWRNEIRTLLGQVAARRGWCEPQIARLQELLLGSDRPHDARLHTPEFECDGGSLVRYPTDGERDRLAELTAILTDRLLQRAARSSPLALLGTENDFQVKVTSLVQSENSDA